MRALGFAPVLMTFFVWSAAGQSFRVTPEAVWISHSEFDKSLEHSGFGFGARMSVTLGKWGVDVEGVRGSLDPEPSAPTGAPFDLTQFDLRATYSVQPAIAILVGASRRWIDPEFAAPDVGFVRVGLLTQTQLARQARVWAHGSYLVAPHFSGGGSAGLAIAVGLGTWIGTADGRYGLGAEYEFQRIDRTVNDAPVPVQMMVAKVGFQLRL